jgi:multidrug efflux pump subunit AcrB
MVEFTYKNRKFVFTLYFFLALLGIYALIVMPRYENPPVTAPGLSIFIGYPGANPADMEKLVLDPIEDVLSEITRIKKVQSICKDDLVEIRIQFHHGVDINEKYREVMEKVGTIEYKLPPDIAYKWFIKWAVSDINIYQLAVIPHKMDNQSLKELIDLLKDDLEALKGVKKVSVYGLPEKKIYIDISPIILEKNQLSYTDIIQLLAASNYALPSGTIQTDDRKIAIHLSSDISGLATLQNLIIKTDGTHSLKLKDIATIYTNYEYNEYKTRYNGKEAIFIALSQEPGTNIFHILKKVRHVIRLYKKQYADSYDFQVAFDQSRTVSHRLNTFFMNLIEGLVLVGLIIFLLIHGRAAIIILIAIPLSLLISVFFLWLAGYGLQQVSIAGMILTLGMLVDNSIVVTENIHRLTEEKQPVNIAVSTGTNQVMWAVFSATGTTILAFLPMLLLNSMVGDFIFTLPLVVILSLTASYIISITLTPILVRLFFTTSGPRRFEQLSHFIKTFQQNYYLLLLKKVIQTPWKFVIIVLFFFILSLGLLPVIGISFFPKAEIPQIMIQVHLPRGSSIQKTDQIVRQVENMLIQNSSIMNFATNIGRGNPRIYYNHFVPLSDPSIAEILCEVPTFQPEEIAKIVQTLRETFSDIAGAKIKVIEFMQGPPQEAPIEIRIAHPIDRKAERLTDQVKAILENIPEVINIETPMLNKKLSLHLNIDRVKASLLGVTPMEIARVVRTALAGTEVGHVRKPNGTEIPIVIRMKKSELNRISDLNFIHVPSITGRQIPLNELVSFRLKSSPVEIRHYNFKKVSMIRADVLRGYSSIKVIHKIENQLKEKLGPDIRWISFGGDKENQSEAFTGLLNASMIAFLLVLLLLVVQFKSYFQPLIILTAIPLGTIGSFLSLLITRNSFSFMAFIGYASLIGIVVNNAIVLVDFINQNLEKGLSLDSAIIKSAETRFRPILSTTITTILGLLPLTIFGGTLWAPLGWVIIGGLLSSTFLTLLIIPALYKIFHKIEASIERG